MNFIPFLLLFFACESRRDFVYYQTYFTDGNSGGCCHALYIGYRNAQQLLCFKNEEKFIIQHATNYIQEKECFRETCDGWHANCVAVLK